jgi:trigger factor
MSEAEISVSTTETSSILRTLEIEVAEPRVRKAFDRAYKDLAKQVRVKGFRPGKAPRTVLERLYGAGLAEELERTLVNESLLEAVQQSGIEPVAEPSIESRPPEAGNSFAYKAAIEVKPAIELPELTGLAATRPSINVEESEIDTELENLRERRAPMVDAEEGVGAESGHHVTIDYAGTIDDVLFEGGSAENAVLELGSGRFIPGFEEQLEGAKVGDAVTVNVTFPDDYPAEDVAGKDAVFAVTVRGIQRKDTPELDDEFVKGMGDDAVQTVDALRGQLRTNLEEQRSKGAEQETRRSVVDSLIERSEFEVPPGMVQQRLSQRLEMAHQQLGQFMPHDEMHEQLNRWQQEWAPDAERDVRESLLLEAVAQEKAFEVASDEVDAKIDQQASDQGIAPDRLREMYDERGLMSGLEAQIREEKALEFLLSEAKVEETTGT